MGNTLAILYADSYKQCHHFMYPKGLTKLISYWVPRRSMFGEDDKMVFFGFQACMKKIQNLFYENFFSLPREEVEETYIRTMMKHFNVAYEEAVNPAKIMELYDLGYLPLEIRVIPEGSIVPMGVPCIELTNTLDDFAWVVQWIECILQAEMWKPCCHATMANEFRKIADNYYKMTTDVEIGLTSSAMSDFSMRGMSCVEEAEKASAAWLLSFDKSSTVPALDYIKRYYEEVPMWTGLGAVSTEHSVQCANFAIDGNEIDFIKRALTELYPNTSFSMVADTYDYWNLVNNLLPQCKEEILNHNGKLLIRPDSGDIVEISVKTVERLWDIFGGSINSKGYKVLDPHIGVIYGDGCTLERVTAIYQQLMEKGFAANNILFGVGAFSFAARQTSDKGMVVYTRDTYGIAMKATCAIIDGKSYSLFKDPKTDTSKTKKSHKGCVAVKRDENNQYYCIDEFEEMVPHTETCLNTVFYDGKLLVSDFVDIQRRLQRENGFNE